MLRRSVGHIFGRMQIAASTVALERVVPREPRQRLLTGFHGHNSFKRHCITAKTWFRIENPGIVQERPDMRVPMNTAVLERVAPLWKQVTNCAHGALTKIINLFSWRAVFFESHFISNSRCCLLVSGLHGGREHHCKCRCVGETYLAHHQVALKKIVPPWLHRGAIFLSATL